MENSVLLLHSCGPDPGRLDMHAPTQHRHLPLHLSAVCVCPLIFRVLLRYVTSSRVPWVDFDWPQLTCTDLSDHHADEISFFLNFGYQTGCNGNPEEDKSQVMIVYQYVFNLGTLSAILTASQQGNFCRHSCIILARMLRARCA